MLSTYKLNLLYKWREGGRVGGGTGGREGGEKVRKGVQRRGGLPQCTNDN